MSQNKLAIRTCDGGILSVDIVRAEVGGITITRRLPSDHWCRRKYVLSVTAFPDGMAMGDRETIREAEALRDAIIDRFGQRLTTYLKRTKKRGQRKPREQWMRELYQLINDPARHPATR